MSTPPPATCSLSASVGWKPVSLAHTGCSMMQSTGSLGPLGSADPEARREAGERGEVCEQPV